MKNHKKYEKCVKVFQKEKKLRSHMKAKHKKKIYGNISSDENINKEKIKCSHCVLLFNIFTFFLIFLV